MPKHRKVGPRAEKLWDRSLLTAQTEEPTQPSVYDPRLSDDEIREMEMACVDPERTIGIELPRRIPNVRRFYRQLTMDVGASQGKKTDYILVQYDRNGDVHGYPVTASYLKRRGAIIP